MTAATESSFEKRYATAAANARAFSDALKGPSLVERFSRLPKEARDAILDDLSMVELSQLRYDWGTWARPKQDPDLSAFAHRILFWLGGRGSGKTIAGANRIRRRVEAGARGIAIVGPTFDDIERYQIMGDGGADGILTAFPPRLKPVYKPHKGLIYFHRPTCTGAGCSSAEACGGALAYINTAEKPEFRGPNLDTVWCDEPAKWRHLEAIWHNIELATRLSGALELEIFFTGTPLPLQVLREIIADEETVTILMAQSENATNLDSKYVARMARKYGGTRLGQQELEGEILSDNPGALFRASVLDAHRVAAAPELEEVAVAVDPGIATGPDNDPTGIVAGGRGVDKQFYIWVDASSRSLPNKWGDDVVRTCEQNETDIVIVERNRGGDLVAANVRAAKARKRGETASLAVKIIEVLATRGKAIRAEPVSTLAEKGFIHIVGHLAELEQEITEWDPSLGGKSPNRLDALVMLVWYLARLGEEEKRDHRAGFKGLSAATAALRAPAAPATGLAAALPRSARGSRL
jgi:phage terminase large subunit-like protein